MTVSDPAPAAPQGPAPAAKRKAGVPVWRVGKPDAFLAAAVETARAALVDIARPEDIGRHVAAKSEGERVVTHLFESLLSGYRGWYWFVTVARISRSKVVTVNEIGLVPSDDAVLAPEWVPWSERVRPEDRAAAEEEAQADGEPAADASEEEAGEERDSSPGTPDGHDAGESPAEGTSPDAATGPEDGSQAEA